MSFLSSLFQMNPNISTVNTQSSGNTNVSAPMNLNSAAAAKLLALMPGQTVQGEVVNIQGGQVQLLLGKEMLLNASLESGIGIDIGQLMSFQVKGNSGSLLSLVPLSVNLTTDENVMKALNEASLPVTDKTVELVNTLMKEGMPIDKESLLQMNRDISAFSKAYTETIVQMARLNLPVTEESILQFEAYKNAEHKLSEGITKMTADLARLFAETGNTQKDTGFLRQMLDFFAGLDKDGVVLKGQSGEGRMLPSAKGETVQNMQSFQGVAGPEEVTGRQEAVSTETFRSAGEVEGEAAANGKDGVVPEAAGKELAEGETTGKTVIGKEEAVVRESVRQNALDTLSPKERTSLFSELKQAGVDAGTLQSLENGQLSAKDLAQLLQRAELSSQQLHSLFSSKAFGKLLLNDMKSQLLLQPEQVSKDNMEEYYSNLKSQTAKLMQVMEGTGRGESAAAKTVQNLNRNLDFMNQINQTFTYVQIPLKLMKDTAHGELYVYTNKKNLAKKDGSVSALLHLDMSHLGTLDIYVAMQNERVSTKFYLQEESAIAFLEEHMELLTNRLAKKGYQTSAEVVLRKEAGAKSVMEEILKQEKNVPETAMIGTRSFDVRA